MSAFKSWRTPMPHGAFRRTLTKTPFPPTRIFDNVSIIGDNTVCCFLIETADGLCMIDNMWPGDELYIEKCILELGYDPADVKHIFITHAHADHWGNAGYFKEKYGTKLWMSKIDEEYGTIEELFRETPPGKGFEPLPFPLDGNLEDNGCFRFGGAEIRTFHTPGHTPGCLSFIFEVFDEGRPHMASLWGGTGLPRNLAWRKQLLDSCRKFAAIGLDYGCDVALSTHPFVDNSAERLNVLRNLVDGVGNPFVLGYEGYHRFESMYEKMYADGVAEASINA